eukprot:1157586-Pelagomonas_calceolata.AAC.5
MHTKTDVKAWTSFNVHAMLTKHGSARGCTFSVKALYFCEAPGMQRAMQCLHGPSASIETHTLSRYEQRVLATHTGTHTHKHTHLHAALHICRHACQPHPALTRLRGGLHHITRQTRHTCTALFLRSGSGRQGGHAQKHFMLRLLVRAPQHRQSF